jgi:hypothetical protein
MFDNKQYNKEYQKKNKSKIRNQRKAHYKKHREHLLLIRKIYRQRNEEQIKKYKIDYYEKNKEEIRDKNKKYYLINKERILEQHNKYEYKKIRIDLNFRITKCLRTRIREALKYNRKIKTTLDLIGCSIDQLKNHLSSQFKSGMFWSNYGKWHIDHIKPCASFDLSKPEEQRKCFHYTNLQPLWAKENILKKDKIVKESRT